MLKKVLLRLIAVLFLVVFMLVIPSIPLSATTPTDTPYLFVGSGAGYLTVGLTGSSRLFVGPLIAENLVCYITWQYGSIFYDATIYHNDANPSFRTTSSDDNVTAAIISQEALVGNEQPEVGVSDAWQMIDDAEKAQLTEQPEGLLREGGISFPGGAEVKKTADAMREPVELLLYPLAIGTSLAAGLLIMKWTHRPEKGIRGSLVLQAFVSLICMIGWVKIGGGVISSWTLIPFGLWAIIAIIFRNPYNPVTS
jgi:hypothetical protein